MNNSPTIFLICHQDKNYIFTAIKYSLIPLSHSYYHLLSHQPLKPPPLRTSAHSNFVPVTSQAANQSQWVWKRKKSIPSSTRKNCSGFSIQSSYGWALLRSYFTHLGQIFLSLETIFGWLVFNTWVLQRSLILLGVNYSTYLRSAVLENGIMCSLRVKLYTKPKQRYWDLWSYFNF